MEKFLQTNYVLVLLKGNKNTLYFLRENTTGEGHHDNRPPYYLSPSCEKDHSSKLAEFNCVKKAEILLTLLKENLSHFGGTDLSVEQETLENRTEELNALKPAKIESKLIIN